jgi:hypothetical protein
VASYARLGIMWRLVKSIFLSSSLLTQTEYHHNPVGQPFVQIGDTVLIGKRPQLSNLEFFGGCDSSSHFSLNCQSFIFRYPFCRTSGEWPPPFSSQAKIFPLSAAIVRCSQLRLPMLTASEPIYSPTGIIREYVRGLSHPQYLPALRCQR